MTTYERLIILSEWVTLLIFRREHMTLSALAQEVGRLKGKEHSTYSLAIDMMFWFDPYHCRNAYVYYRTKRRQIYRNTQCP